MKTSTKALQDTLKQDMAIRVQPRLIAEWEYNRYFSPDVTVTPDQSGDTAWTATFGNVDSMTVPFRPTAGIARARTDSGVRPIDNDTSRTPATTRYYPSGDADRYNYFASLQRSQLAKKDDGYEFDEKIVVTALYDQKIAVNKIVIGFESGYALPQSFSIQISPDGNSWQTINTNTVIDSDGLVTLWHGSKGGSGWGGTGWDIEPEYDSPVVIKGVRLNVYSMNKPYSHLDVLQISPRLENDLTPYLVKYEVDNSQDSPSFISPLGKASSNTAQVTLSNIDGRFNNDNEDSLYYGMVEKKVRFKLDLGIDTSNHGGTGLEYVREFTMWTDKWGAQDNSTIQVDLKDSSVLLQEATMPSMFLQNSTVGSIVWQTLDTIGMNNYAYTRADSDYGQVIPFYWPSDSASASNPRWGRMSISGTSTPSTTIWDEFSTLVEATQTALFFDEYDVLQIVPREAMYHEGKAIDWNLDAVRNGAKMPDVVSSQVDYDLVTNQVEITYKPCAFSDDQNGLPRMEKVWEPASAVSDAIVPDDSDAASSTTVVLMASAMARDCKAGDTELWIHQPEAVVWPFSSDINIEGEVLHYTGKEYAYYAADNSLQTAIVTSTDDQHSHDKLNANLSWKNSYTGKLVLDERGKLGTVASDHLINTELYTSLMTSYDNSVFYSIGGYVTQNDGYITMSTPVTNDVFPWNQTYHLRKHESAVHPTPLSGYKVWYGSKIRFTTHGVESSSGANWSVGGIWFAGDWGDAGYFLEITPTTQIDGWEKRTWRNEICLIGMPGNAPAFQITGDNGDNKGFTAAVLPDTWYALDVSYAYDFQTNQQIISVFLDGVAHGTWHLPPDRVPVPFGSQWRFGTHVRGPSTMDIEYLYAIAEDPTNPLTSPDNTTFLDLETGGFTSGFVRKNIKYNFQHVAPTYRWPWGAVYDFPQIIDEAGMIFDEYGPVVHEIRTFNVAFTDNYLPVVNSWLYLANSAQVEIMSYQSDMSGATFMLANAHRTGAIVNGEDTVTAGPDNTLNQTMFIYGRVVYTAQNDSKLTKKDDAAIRKQGLTKTEFTSRYIQTADMANAIGDWILDLWAGGVDQVSADLFGNPLLQVGDLVTMNFPTKGMSPNTHKYYVVSVKGTFETGYQTTVTLRRARV